MSIRIYACVGRKIAVEGFRKEGTARARLKRDATQNQLDNPLCGQQANVEAQLRVLTVFTFLFSCQPIKEQSCQPLPLQDRGHAAIPGTIAVTAAGLCKLNDPFRIVRDGQGPWQPGVTSIKQNFLVTAFPGRVYGRVRRRGRSPCSPQQVYHLFIRYL